MEFCKVMYDYGQINYLAPKLISTDINEIVENDKRYGKMIPRNGKYFTFRVSDTHDQELTNKQMVRAVLLAWQHWESRIDFPIQKANANEEPDFRVIFRTPDTDERGELTDNTIMYHYFPINDVNHELRGLCVVNSLFYYTVDGEPVAMYEIDPDNYTEDSNATGSTVDVDQVFEHEFGHGIGLPHDSAPFNVMSPNYGIMAEFLTERDVFRGVKKYGVPRKKPSWFSRWFNYLRHRSDRY